MKKGQFKVTDYSEIRECVECNERKLITEFVKGKRNLYRYLCKECKNKKRRTGKVSETRFKKGQKSIGVTFKKGHTPWYKVKGAPPPSTGKVDEKNSCRFTSHQYKKWRREVFEKEGEKCRLCDSKKRLAAHHLVAWRENEKLRFDPRNGICLCVSCHATHEAIVRNVNKNK